MPRDAQLSDNPELWKDLITSQTFENQINFIAGRMFSHQFPPLLKTTEIQNDSWKTRPLTFVDELGIVCEPQAPKQVAGE